MIATAHDVTPRSRIAGQIRSRLTVRRLRLATGCVLFAYILVHLINHAVGNVSLDAMEAVLDWVAFIVALPVVSQILYGSLAVHAALGLWALYARPRLDWRPGELAQIVLGFAIVPLLASHVLSTRLAYTLYGTTLGYSQLLYKFWVTQKVDGALQVVSLLVAWIHGCFGLHYWLRLKPFYPRAASLLLCGAVLVPVLALLGYWQAGRAVAVLAANEDWLVEHAPGEVADQIRLLTDVKQRFLVGFGALIVLALAGRLLRTAARRRRGLISLTYPGGAVLRVPRGMSVLEVSRMYRIPHASVCGGRGRCSTCRIRVLGPGSAALPPVSAEERAVLDRVGAGEGVRLACQLRPPCDLSVTPLLPPHTDVANLANLRGGAFGEERFVAAMFVDMRGSTLLGERRLPYDTVFIINRFLDAVGSGIVDAGGSTNQFLGDGVMALFGVTVTPALATRQALAAVELVGRNVEALNDFLAGTLEQPIRFGIGLHAGTAILGDMGGTGSGHTAFTAIGDPVNVASRLQGMTKRLGVEVLISDVVFETAGVAADDLPRQEVPIDGRSGQLWVRPVEKASAPLTRAAAGEAVAG